MRQTSYQTMELLFVEKNPAFVNVAQHVLQQADADINLHVLNNGDDVVDFVKNNKTNNNKLRPDLIMISLDVPGNNGRNIITTIKQDEILKRVPLIVFTDSHSEKEIYELYSNYANCCIKKPSDETKFVSVLEIIKNFWLTIVKLPSE